MLVPITDKGVLIVYDITASHKTIVDTFINSSDFTEFEDTLLQGGYQIQPFHSVLSLNFDMKEE